eukprot:269903-Amphidinium_carterae.1
MKKGGKGAKGKKGGQWSYPTSYGQEQGYGYQQPPGYSPAAGGYSGYSGYSGQPLNPGQPPANGYNPKGKGHGKQPWNNFGKGKKGQVANITTYPQEDPNAYNEPQQWYPEGYTQDWDSWQYSAPTANDYQQYAEQQPVQHIGLFG